MFRFLPGEETTKEYFLSEKRRLLAECHQKGIDLPFILSDIFEKTY